MSKKKIIILIIFVLLVICLAWYFWPADCSKRSAGAGLIGSDNIPCEKDHKCRLMQTSSCPVCDDIISYCASNQNNFSDIVPNFISGLLLGLAIFLFLLLLFIKFIRMK